MLTVLVPTRGRPHNAKRLIDAAYSTMEQDDTRFIFHIDDDDPKKDDYVSLFVNPAYDTLSWFGFTVSPRLRVAGTLNEYAPRAATAGEFVGHMNDDHIPLTAGWDTRIVDTLREMKMGIVYGNDLLQGVNLATAPFMTSNIVTTLGYMCPPNMTHLYTDNVWMDWGRGIDSLRYLNDVIIEHRHPVASKAEWDAGYEDANGGDRYEEALRQYSAYCEVNLAADISKLVAVKSSL